MDSQNPWYTRVFYYLASVLEIEQEKRNQIINNAFREYLGDVTN